LGVAPPGEDEKPETAKGFVEGHRRVAGELRVTMS
jgi:hypothetical protein